MQKQKKRKPQPKTESQATHVAPATPETVEKKQDKQRLDPDLYAPLPMNHQKKAWQKAAIKRKMRNGILDINKIAEYTQIPIDEVLPIFIEITDINPVE